MKKILLFAALLLPFLAFAQFPNNPNKMRLGVQTTADGLIFRSDSLPDYTPTSNKNAWFHFDTVAQKLYYHIGGSWEEFSGGTGIDSLKIENDSLYLYTNEGTFSDAIPTPDSTLWATLYALQDTAAAIRDDVPAPDGNGIYSGSGTVPANTVARSTGFGPDFRGNTFPIILSSTSPVSNIIGFRRDTVETPLYYMGYTTTVTPKPRFGIFTNNIAADISLGPLVSSNTSFTMKQDSLIYAFSGTNYKLRTDALGTSTDHAWSRPTGSASFWQHNTNGTGEYKTPGAMTVVNPLGGTNTLQASLDSLEQSQNQIIIAADSFYVDDGTIVYLVSAGDTITLPTGGGGSDGNGIYSGSGNIPGGTTATATGNFTLRTISADEGIAWTADSIRMYGVGASVRTGADLAIHDGVSYGADGQVMTAGSGIKAEWTDVTALPVTNPLGGSNTLQASLDSIADLAASAGVDGNGIYGGSGSLPSDVTVTGGDFGLTVTTTNPLKYAITTDGIISYNVGTGTSHYYGITTGTSTNNVLGTVVLDRLTTGTAANGIGQSISLKSETTNGFAFPTNEITSIWSNATHASRTSRLILRGVNNGSGPNDLFTLDGNGQLTLNTYGTEAFSGFAIANLSVTSTGSVIKTALPAPPPNVGGLGSYGTLSAAYTYTVQPLGTASPVISLPTDGHTFFVSMQKVISGAGHGFQSNAGGDFTAEIIANVSIEPTTGTHPYYLQVYLNGSPIDMVAAQTVASGTVGNLSLSFLYQVPNNGIITMQLHSSDVRDVSILTRSLTVKKIQ